MIDIMTDAATPGFRHGRPDLAHAYCNTLAGQNPLQDRRSGLFLSAPKGTGKTFFITHDLRPELMSRGWYPIIVDLWKSRQTSPLQLIENALTDELKVHKNELMRRFRDHVPGAWLARLLEVDFKSCEDESHPPIGQLLQLMRNATKQKIALVLDEAQQVILHPDGDDAMAELKAARDDMHKAGVDMNLFLVFTSSSRNKLSRMVIRRGEPFYGSTVHPFPLLGEAFITNYTGWINQSLVEPEQIDPADMAVAFSLVGHRPDELKEAIVYAVVEADKTQTMASRLMDGAKRQRDQHRDELDRLYDDLPALARIVFDKLLMDEQWFSPFSKRNRRHFAAQLGLDEVSAARVQRALMTLSKHDLIWTPRRGVYVLEDSSVADWYASRHEEVPDTGSPAQTTTG